MRTTRLFLIAFTLILAGFTTTDERKIKVWLVGDSTCADKQVRAFPETGWGMPFRFFFDSTVQVNNRAVNGRSTRSFIAENRWQMILDSVQAGDYVFVQFGHNDEVKEKVDRYTSPDEFKSNLRRYVNEARAKKAIPVLLTPVARRTFDSATSKLRESHPVYSDAVRQVAVSLQAPLIDLDAMSMKVLSEMGPESSRLLFLHLKPGEHPNYPDGKTDNTHFNELGARIMAQLVLSEIQQLKLPLADRIVGRAARK